MVTRKSAFVGLLLAGMWLSTLPARAIDEQEIPRRDLFPLPPSIKANVDFWVDVYTKYTSDQLIIHDSRYPNIIYEVADLRKVSGGKEVSERTRRTYAKTLKGKYAGILRRLARGGAAHPEKLSGDDKKVFELWKNIKQKNKFWNAARNIRAQRGNRDFFLYGIRQSGRYIDQMRAILRAHGLPGELAVLPHVESSFNARAYSHMGAAGIWQFTRRTGRLFLDINYEVDERFDPLLSTEAAAQLLAKSYQELGTWPLAITAYNHGLAGMKRAVQRLGTRDFDTIVTRYKSPSFKFASRNFYAEFLAALHVRTYKEKYFGNVEMLPPDQFVQFELPDYVPAKAIADQFDISLDELRRLNPALRRPVWRGERHIPRGYRLRLPSRLDLDPGALYAALPDNLKYAHQVRSSTYRVRRGENLGLIARKLGVSVRDLVAFNDIRNPNRIRAGQLLNVPPKGYRRPLASAQLALATPKATDTPATDKATEIAVPTTEPAAVTEAEHEAEQPVVDLYWVPLDTLPEMAMPEEIPTLAERIDEPTNGWIEVQPEETLGHYADWLKVPTQELRRLNGLAYGQDIRVGQRIRLTFRAISASEFHRQRIDYLRSIEEDFFSTYRVAAVDTHVVRKGENIWDLCNRVYEIPYWLVMLYNSELDLGSLHARDQIRIPVLEPLDKNRPDPSES